MVFFKASSAMGLPLMATVIFQRKVSPSLFRSAFSVGSVDGSIQAKAKRFPDDAGNRFAKRRKKPDLLVADRAKFQCAFRRALRRAPET